jgi:hypothetical protein
MARCRFECCRVASVPPARSGQSSVGGASRGRSGGRRPGSSQDTRYCDGASARGECRAWGGGFARNAGAGGGEREGADRQELGAGCVAGLASAIYPDLLSARAVMLSSHATTVPCSDTRSAMLLRDCLRCKTFPLKMRCLPVMRSHNVMLAR